MVRQLQVFCVFLIGAACLILILACQQLAGYNSLLRARSPLFQLENNRTSNESGSEDTLPKQLSVENRASEFQDAINDQRLLIRQEMVGYNYSNGQNKSSATSLKDFVPELGGQPRRSIIITTWRSGSTFLGDVLNSHPANYYHYEPLVDYGIVQLREEHIASEAVSKLKAMLHCNYTGLDHYLNFGKHNNWLFLHNTRLWSQCKKYKHLCWLPEFLSSLCRLFPFQSMKVLRLRLEFAEKLLKDASLNVKLLLLVRDPRGTLQSRKHREWCPGRPDCSEPAFLCSDLEADYIAASNMNAKYPDRFRVVRYEDLSLKPYMEIKDIFNFFGLDFHPSVQKFLDTHTKANVGGVSSTFRNSTSAPFHWRQDLTHEEVQTIQQVCRPAMEHWGYHLAVNSTHQRDFNPVGSFSLTDIVEDQYSY